MPDEQNASNPPSVEHAADPATETLATNLNELRGVPSGDPHRPPIEHGVKPPPKAPTDLKGHILAEIAEARGLIDFEHPTAEDNAKIGRLLTHAVADLVRTAPDGSPLKGAIHKLDSARSVLAGGKLTYEERLAQAAVFDEACECIDAHL